MRYLRIGPTANAQAPRPPLVLIHGLLGYSFSWRHNLAAFARERTVYAVDLPGIGYSDRPAPGTLDLSLEATASRMLEWLSALGISRVDLLGTSHGGALAMMMAALAPRQPQEREELIGRLVLAAPVNPWSRAGRFRIALLRTPLGGWMARQSARLRRARWIAIRRLYADPAKLTGETFAGYSRMMDIPGTLDYCLAIVKTWHRDMAQLKPRLESIQLPALLIWGSLDGAVPPASGRELAAHLKRSELVIMPGAGHMPYEEAPAEFNRLVLKFLDHPNETAAPPLDSLPQIV
ncbi:MAG: alpha/beta fold hydrolase [Candidatus Korobacteraceae bacterium]|jgi:pimeloyl-ACP methyl ester carboxylesterase